MTLDQRKGQFIEAIKGKLGPQGHVSANFGESNIARMTPVGIYLGISNLESVNLNEKSSVGSVSRLMPLPGVEVYICAVIESDIQNLIIRLTEMKQMAQSGDATFRDSNNNVLFILNRTGNIYIHNRKLDESNYQELLRNPIKLETLFYSVYLNEYNNINRRILKDFLNGIADYAGADKIIDLHIWDQSGSIGSPSIALDYSNANQMIERFSADITSSHLRYDISLISNFVSALITKPFVILTGLSGSGKTKLAQAFAKWISQHDAEGITDQYVVVAVGADWDNNENLFGYPDALHQNHYIKPANGVLDLIIRATKAENIDKPYFLILDEMNLSHVERYFADILSNIESGETITLHAGVDDLDGVPPKLKFPDNLFVIGTVNIDETTYLFSPKVLDRANVIEVRVSKEDIDSFLNLPNGVDLYNITGNGAIYANSFVKFARTKESKIDNIVYDESKIMRILNGSDKKATEQFVKEKLKQDLLSIFDTLEEVGAEFGYRTTNEIQRFFYIYSILKKDANYNNALDAQIMQKILPKLHGSIRKLDPVLDRLIEKCGTSEGAMNLTVSHQKLKYMKRNLERNGFTSFAEV